MANDIAPSFVQIRYQSSYGLHTQSLPTRAYEAEADNAPGTFNRWSDGNAISVTDMMDAYIAALRAGFHTSTTIIDYTVFNKSEGEGNNPIPVFFDEVGLAGTNAATDWRKATQMTLTFRSGNFGVAKLVTLDTPHGGFDRFVPGAAAAWVSTLATLYMNPVWAFAARDNSRPSQWLQGTVTLNERLRRAYGMT